MGQTSIKIPNWKSLCNPNLLMNSDYRSGIINQKGITSLDKSDGSTELGIDGWILYGINIAVGSNYVTFANRTNTTHTVQQPLDIKGLNAGDKVTVYVSAFNITGSIYVYLTGLDAQRKKLVNGDNKFTFTLTSEIERFYIQLAPNAVISFNCKKLEIGEHFTGMPPWNKAIELLKCQRYLQFIDIVKTFWTNQYQEHIESVYLTVVMNKTPSGRIENTSDLYGMTDISVKKTSNNYVSISYTPSNSTGWGHRFQTRIELDAYDYD